MAGQNSRDIKRRIRSVANTRKITKALQTVSAVKMKKAQAHALAGRAYATEALFLLRRLEGLADFERYPLLKKKNTGKQLVLMISPDKGLTGSLFANLSRQVGDLIQDQAKNKKRQTDIYGIGNQAVLFAKRMGYKLIKGEANDKLGLRDARRIKNNLVDLYLHQGYDKIILAYTQFVSTLKQKPFIRGVLPITVKKIVDLEVLPEKLTKRPVVLSSEVYELEPSPGQLLRDLVPDLVTMLIYHSILEANASEHSARMIAMKNAHDNANELIEDLTQTFNKLRQESITSALAEISAGVAALENNN